MTISTPTHLKLSETLEIFAYQSTISAGFPSPADDFAEHVLNLNEYLIKHPAATYFVRVKGSSMKESGIFHDDILIVDRSVRPSAGAVIIAVLDGELMVRHYREKNGTIYLEADGETIVLTQERDFSVWGVVTYVIHRPA